jgi:hypothetical protein
MLASRRVPSERTYLRSRSAVDGVGLGVDGGIMFGCRLSLNRAKEVVRGGAEIRDDRGVSGTLTGTDDM